MAKRLLLVFDGGDAPGYQTVATFLTAVAERRGWEVWAATEGFRSLVGDGARPPRLERLVFGRDDAYRVAKETDTPVRAMERRLLDPGSDFRSERFQGFSRPEAQAKAAQFVRETGATHLVCVGGNGTYRGCAALDRALEGSVKTGFVNVSVDSDLSGDRSIGFLTGIEHGARMIRGLVEDAFTHARVYAVSMMGNRSGKHALHAGVSAGAQLVLLPVELPDSVLHGIAQALSKVRHAVVVVPQGWASQSRVLTGASESAAERLVAQLEPHGLRDRPDRRVIAEPVSRYLRGLPPMLAEVGPAHLKCRMLLEALDGGATRVMPWALSELEFGIRSFDEVDVDNRVPRAYLPLLDGIGISAYRGFLEEKLAQRTSQVQ